MWTQHEARWRRVREAVGSLKAERCVLDIADVGDLLLVSRESVHYYGHHRPARGSREAVGLQIRAPSGRVGYGSYKLELALYQNLAPHSPRDRLGMQSLGLGDMKGLAARYK